MRSSRIQVDTSKRWYVDLTEEARSFTRDHGDGLLNVFVPHATAGLAIMELGDGSEADLAVLIERLLPRNPRYTHQHGSPGHGADHLLPVLLSPSITVPVQDGRPLLGTWQHLVLVDTNPDNHHREVLLSFVPGQTRD
jgi:secondary thiamine-phosphate synthase enzyme